MGHPEGERETCDVRLSFARRVRLEFHGSKISSDGGLMLFRELDEVVRHARAITFQFVEVAVSGDLFNHILAAIQRLCAPTVP